jgi:hypothetical protein
MDAKLFLKQVRTIIREEIEYALDKKLSEKKKVDVSKSINHGVSLYKEAQQISQKKPSNQKKSQTPKNMSAIQELLEETRRSLQENYDGDYDNEISFTTNSLNAFANNTDGAVPSGVNPNDLTPEVSKALTRDYSALMAKINEKKGA